LHSPEPSLRELVATSARIGCFGFGGPAGQIALMHRVFVEEKRWIDEDRFQHALSFCMLLPGPEAQQLATYVGWRLRGAAGALIAGWLFVLPGAAVVLALSWIYVVWGALAPVAAAFDGVKCAVIALVVEALVRIGRRALKTRAMLAVALAAFAALMFGAPFPVVIVAAGALGYFLAQAPVQATGAVAARAEEGARASLIRRHALLWLLLWFAPIALAALILGADHLLVEIGLLFSLLAVVTFGGAYALLAYLSTEAAARGWLTPAQMIDGLGLAETTPGPLILVNQFVGFVAGWGEAGIALALAGAAMASWCTFAPSFVWIFAGAPYAERLRENARAATALAFVSAAVLGVVAKLAVFFGAFALFTRQVTIAGVTLPDVAAPKLWAIGLALAAALALMRWKAPLLVVLAVCAMAGWGARALGL